MREGHIYLNNEEVYLQKLNGEWCVQDGSGWKKLDRTVLVQNIIEDLQGTCKSLTESCESHNLDFDELDCSELNQIDQNIFLCDGCGWWWEMGEDTEYDEQVLCRHCYDDREDDLDALLNS